MAKKINTAKPKAAVYDRWLYTLGGGEQVAFAYAEVLRDLGFETDLISHKEIDVSKAQDKMDVNLTGIHLRYLPIKASVELSEYTEEYDVFINTSYLDYFPNRSKFGVLSVFFPGQIYLSLFDYLKRALVVPSLKKFFIYPIDFHGFRFDEWKNRTLYKWLGKESTITFNAPVNHISLTLWMRDFGFSRIEELTFLADDQEVQPVAKSLMHQENKIDLHFIFPQETLPEKITIVNPHDPENTKIALISFTIQDYHYTLYNLFKRFFPRWEMRLHGGPELTKRSDLESYDTCITISEFVQKWTTRYWGISSHVLYPPVNTRKFSAQKKKKNWILHIGRFFVTGHNKKQLDLAKVFTNMCDQGEIKDWELHFIGSVHEGDEHQAYFDAVKKQAEGYPVVFHTDVNFEELKDIVEKSKIYWHATGLDENEEQSPILMEHFGITTVEAMAAGCVPVVIASGGQKEIVTPESGYLWNTRQELTDFTLKLIQNDSTLKKMSKAAVVRSKYFDREEFKKRLALLLEPALRP